MQNTSSGVTTTGEVSRTIAMRAPAKDRLDGLVVRQLFWHAGRSGAFASVASTSAFWFELSTLQDLILAFWSGDACDATRRTAT